MKHQKLYNISMQDAIQDATLIKHSNENNPESVKKVGAKWCETLKSTITVQGVTKLTSPP